MAVGTMHLAKGLDLRAIAVVACDDEVLPQQTRIESVADDADLEDVYDTERQLLYAACTRARDHQPVTGVARRIGVLGRLEHSLGTGPGERTRLACERRKVASAGSREEVRDFPFGSESVFDAVAMESLAKRGRTTGGVPTSLPLCSFLGGFATGRGAVPRTLRSSEEDRSAQAAGIRPPAG